MATFAYADPPYQGCANRYPEKQEVDPSEVAARLRAHDGWALSENPAALRTYLPLLPEARVLAWCKPYAPSRPNVQPVYAWEVVLLKRIPGRVGQGRDDWSRDWLTANPAGMTGGRGNQQRVLGQKPAAFCHWLFRCAGLDPDDTFLDMFPGSGAVQTAWSAWRRRDRPEPLALAFAKEGDRG